MGINLIWVCHRHGHYHYSLRGEEGIDFQALIRTPSETSTKCPSYCFREGRITVYRDADFDQTDGDWLEWWPVWEDRPGEVLRRLAGRGRQE